MALEEEHTQKMIENNRGIEGEGCKMKWKRGLQDDIENRNDCKNRVTE